jgi:hypothetical protein
MDLSRSLSQRGIRPRMIACPATCRYGERRLLEVTIDGGSHGPVTRGPP